MFTGIVQGIGKITSLIQTDGPLRIEIAFPRNLLGNLITGASVAVNGVCLTVAAIRDYIISFDAIPETLEKTNLVDLSQGDEVNLERSACFGDEIGGHILSGHIFGTALLEIVPTTANQQTMAIKIPIAWSKYFFPKGYIALDGVSLTIMEIDKTGIIQVGLIPETLQRTTFGKKEAGLKINIEIDSLTQTIVDSVERMMHDHYPPRDYPCEPIY
jgi:riboflavin synthase